MKVCGECGARNADHSYLCVQCGAQLGEQAPAAEQGYTGDTDQIRPQEAVSAEDLVSQASDVLADGRASEAVGLCERALALEPNHLPAFALLGMAHEESGHLQAALDAYDNVLRIDPTRAAERQKVNLLKLQILRGDLPSSEADDEQAQTWLRYAPVALAVGAALLVFVVGALLIISARNAHRLASSEETYDLAMAAGNAAMADARYAKAISHFLAALEARPDDKAADLRLQRARELLTGEGGTQAAQLPKYIPSTGPNPFAPVVIPPTKPEEAAAAGASSPMPTTIGPRSLYEEVRGGSRTSGGAQKSAAEATASKGSVKNDLVISPRNDGKTAKASDVSPSAATPTPEPGPGQISIWTSDRPAPAGRADETAGNPEELRSKANGLKGQGRYKEAAACYGDAIEAYRRRIDQSPQLRSATQTSIDACKTQQDWCNSQR